MLFNKVDRRARDVLAECLRQFLEGELTFDELEYYVLAEDFGSSKDKVVKDAAISICIDELDDPQGWPKSQWDSVQRWLLLLDSDRQIEDTSEYTWTRWQLVAVFGVAFFVGFALLTTFAFAFTWLSVPSGILSWYITRKKSAKLTPKPYEHVLEPFESFTSMRATLDEVNETFGFVKMKQHKPGPRIRLRQMSTIEKLIYCCLLPTIFLLPFQAFPICQYHRSVVPGQALSLA